MNLRRLLSAALLASAFVSLPACDPHSQVEGNPPQVDAGSDAGSDPQPTPNDTDGDGLPDSVEDANGNGRQDVGETDPQHKDSDCDGLIDGPNAGSLKGEDQNANGVVDIVETDPRLLDTDRDGLTDGVERGATVNVDPGNCSNVPLDGDPTTITDPTDPDSDDDGVPDGAEDNDQDGELDPGELNPGDGSDVKDGPSADVCTEANLRPVGFRLQGEADLQIALPALPRFAESADIVVGGAKVGFMGYDSASQVAYLAYKQAAPAGAKNPTEDEAALDNAIGAAGALSNELVQTFTTWDGYPALKAQYDQAGTANVRERANDLVKRLLPSSTGALTAGAGGNGPFRVQAEFVHRSDQSVVVVLALTPLTALASEESSLFTVNDLSAGSSLAQFADTTAVQCEPFETGSAKVDFLFVVDDSGSMADMQNAVGIAATEMADRLGNSSLDWRVAVVTSSYHFGSGPNSNLLRGFTRDIQEFKRWLTKHPDCTDSQDQCGSSGVCRGSATGWVGVCGSGNEGILGAARKATDDLTPGATTETKNKMRADADLVVILLGDADDQTTGYSSTAKDCGTDQKSCVPASDFAKFFLATGSTAETKNKLEKPITVHGIVCPASQVDGKSGCGEFNVLPQRHGTVVEATGGIKGAILVSPDPSGSLTEASISNAMTGIVADVIGRGGYKLKKAPIGPSIKVALQSVLNETACNAKDIPRSRVNGFDFNGSAIAFYGACRAKAPETAAAVSYRYWVDGKSDPNGSTPCEDDPKFDPSEGDFCDGNFACESDVCVCKAPPEGCPGGFIFNPDPARCACIPQIG